MHAGSVHAVLTLVKSASEAKGHARVATGREEKGGAPGGETWRPELLRGLSADGLHDAEARDVARHRVHPPVGAGRAAGKAAAEARLALPFRRPRFVVTQAPFLARRLIRTTLPAYDTSSECPARRRSWRRSTTTAGPTSS
jgi:hypothetical protein